MASHRFDSQSGAATRFKKGHKGMGGRPPTRHLVKAFEALASKTSNPKAPIWERTNVAEAVVLEFMRQAMRGSVRHAEVFLRFIQPHLGKLLNAGRFGRILAQAIEEIRKGGQQRDVDAHTFPQAQQQVHRIVVDAPEPPRRSVWDEINRPTRESVCLSDDIMHRHSTR